MLATVEELKRYLAKDQAKIVDDPILGSILASASSFCERETGRQFEIEPALVNTGTVEDPVWEDTASAVPKTFSTEGRRLVPIKDLREASAVTLDGEPVSPTSASTPGYVLARSRPYTAIRLSASVSSADHWDDLVITGRWGWNPVPAEVKDAVLVLAARRYRERDAAYADTIGNPETGSLAYYRVMPAYVKAVFDNYRHPSQLAA